MPEEQTEGLILSCGLNLLKTARYGKILYNPNDIYVGKSIDYYGEFSEGEASLFRHLLKPGAVVLDIGAHIGSHTLVFAKAAGPQGAVLAFEPQRVIFQALCANMALNGLLNAFCYHAAVGESQGSLFVPILDYHTENNFAGLSLGNYSNGEKVQLMTIDGLLLQQCHFIKIDVEGMELNVLKGATGTIKKFKPILYLENDRKEKSSDLIKHIDSLGYRMYWHLPPLFNKDNFFNNEKNIFENIVSVNMLCIHSSINIELKGFKEIKDPDDWFDAVDGGGNNER